jgi:hypothetical protein
MLSETPGPSRHVLSGQQVYPLCAKNAGHGPAPRGPFAPQWIIGPKVGGYAARNAAVNTEPVPIAWSRTLRSNPPFWLRAVRAVANEMAARDERPCCKLISGERVRINVW